MGKYKKYKHDIITLHNFPPPSSSKAAAFTEAFLKNSIKTPARLDLDTLLAHKAVILGYTRPKKDTTKRKSKKAKGLGARQKRVMKIFQIKAEHQRYELFLPLHQLWRHYILDLCGGLKPSGWGFHVDYVGSRFYVT
uniref:Uncharacterized protein n=1 Tax=Nothobranchius furzeri TaxID=105023 RepID=A0A8C6M8F6_NOTFU